MTKIISFLSGKSSFTLGNTVFSTFIDIAMAFSIHSIHNFHHKSSHILPCDFGKYLDQSYHILGGCTISCDMCFMSACSLDNPQTYQIDWQGWGLHIVFHQKTPDPACYYVCSKPTCLGHSSSYLVNCQSSGHIMGFGHGSNTETTPPL